MRFLSAVVPPPGSGGEAWWFLFHGDRLLVETRGEDVGVPFWSDPAGRLAPPVRTQFLGTLDGRPCFSGELDRPAAPAGTEFRPLRSLLGILPEDLFSLAGRAFQIMHWDRTHQYCGMCGMRTEPVEGERAKGCARCGIQFFPRVTPAVIVAVVRDRKILLAHARRSPAVFYSVLAGFVEAGETFEECVRREVREETGIEVGNIRYFGSQPWPFPHAMMVGFTAEYAGGDLVLEEKEIVQAGWFGPDEVPRLQIPRHGTIARELIGWFLAKCGDGGKRG
jgi:NAD+ diphosphatase